MSEKLKKFWKGFKDEVKKHPKLFIIYLVIIFVAYGCLFIWLPKINKPQEVSYTEFKQLLDAGEVDTVFYSDSDEDMHFTLLNDVTKNMTPELRKEYKHPPEDIFSCKYPAYFDFRKDVLEAGADIERYDDAAFSNFAYILVNVLLPVILIAFFFFLYRNQFGGFSEKDLIQSSDVSFDDVIGHDEIIDDVKFITALIKDPSKGEKVGAKMPKGILFVGPPGTGKTLLAKAIAHEAGVPFLYQNASGFIEMYVGLGARRVRDLFKVARSHAPCILFIDEIDSIGGKRGSVKGTSEHEQTINAILQEMDGFTGREGVFVIAATNRADSLDDALVRSGRFDRQIVVNPPSDWLVRRDLFKHYLDQFAVSDDLDVDSLSKQTSGFTGADIAMICNEASMIAVMKDKDVIDKDCMDEAIDKKVFKGNRAKRHKHDNDRNIIAYHEAGHAIVSCLLGEPIARASIQSTTSGVGGAVFNEDKDSVFMTDRDMRYKIMIAYAGRASEQIKFGDVTTGASNDITQATAIMVQFVEKMGFDKDYGLLDTSVLSENHILDSKDVMTRISKMSKNLYRDTVDLLNDHYDKVEILAQKLLEVESVPGSFVTSLFEEDWHE